MGWARRTLRTRYWSAASRCVRFNAIQAAAHTCGTTCVPQGRPSATPAYSHTSTANLRHVAICAAIRLLLSRHGDGHRATEPPRAAPKLTVTRAARPPQESVPQGREQQNETVVIRWGIQFRTRRRRRPPHTFRSRPLRSRVPGSTPPSHSLFALRQIHQHLFLSAVTRATPKGRLTARITVHCPACSPTSALAAHQPTAIPSARPSEPAQRQPLGRRWMICARPKT